jgi:ribosomal-protein-alanine N-acetyltransferase
MPNMMIELNTERLIIRQATGRDCSELLELYVRNREFWRQWEPAREEDYFREESMGSMIDEAQRNAEQRRSFLFLLRLRDDQRMIGSVSLSNIVYGAFLSCHLGYKLDADFTGRGLMREALNEVIRFAFTDLGLHRIEANIMPANQSSRNLVRSLGFRSEGKSPEYLRINGSWEEHEHFVVLNRSL